MKKIVVFIGILLGLASATLLPPFPQTEITNGIIRAKLYLPDSVSGYYQGVRFDWSGVIASLDYKDHSYFGQWFEKNDPKGHDAISGPVEEFTPIGYDEAKPGGDFLKIGVGSLRKSKEAPYRFATPYAIVNPGKRTVKTGRDAVVFTHELSDAAGYSYVYQKTVKLLKGKPVLVLEHSLKNTGPKTIETTVYDHNFFMLDHQPTGPDVSVTFPFDLQIKPTRGIGTFATIQGNRFVYLNELPKGESTHCYLTGFGDSAKDYDFRVENRKTGAGVRVVGDQPIVQLAFWSINTTVCPEPYIQIKAEPGQTFRWKISYDYYTLPKTASTR
ncbi:hypothetical protein GCM10028803_13120 [Larkinella knui]|uniref:Uncharacterized protein n=1 Tax=Larkinella knui TaxID=2025310 RepID=A0A3P1CBT5_9BACT|nr:hypothetical protein [Larkinella knui]RRB10735.1 hypothetical protein EHT87_26630 [Larkinella knui]